MLCLPVSSSGASHAASVWSPLPIVIFIDAVLGGEVSKTIVDFTATTSGLGPSSGQEKETRFRARPDPERRGS